MKHSKFTRILAVIMSLVLMTSVVTVTASAYNTPTTGASVQVTDNEETKESRIIIINGEECDLKTFKGIIKAFVHSKSGVDTQRIFYGLLENYIWEPLVNFFHGLFKNPESFIDEEEYLTKNFYSGTEGEFLDEPVENAVWKLGYSQKSIMPESAKTDKKYYPGGYFYLTKIDPEQVYDDIKVRAIALDAGNGTVLFATIDAIGISNADVRDIRSKLAEYAEENNIVSVNVFATHCHSSIDTMGIWSHTFSTIFSNLIKNKTGKGIPESGIDATFLKLVKTKTVAAMKEAHKDMEEGTLTFASYDASAYINNTRIYYQNDGANGTDEIHGAEDKMMERFVFTPTDENSEPTMIVNSNAHPNMASLNDKNVMSSDYVYGMEQVINEAGYNFMFFNGAISGVHIDHKGVTQDGNKGISFRESSYRWGYELGFHMIYITKSEAELANDEEVIAKRNQWLPAVDNYESGKGTPWYTGKVASEEVELAPILNIRHQELKVKTDSPLMKLVCKAELINANVLVDEDGNYKYVTEIGYMEIGDKKIAFVPGEIEPALVYGGDILKAEYSFTGTDYQGSILKDVMEDEDLIVIGLANDEIGYIVPDNDYCNFPWVEGHKQELLVLNPNLGSELVQDFEELYDSVK